VNYDEFIVFSADADFTPVLRKLRRWDRRTTVLAVGFPSAAYRASADLLIDPDQFLRDGLGLREGEDGGAGAGANGSHSTTLTPSFNASYNAATIAAAHGHAPPPGLVSLVAASAQGAQPAASSTTSPLVAGQSGDSADESVVDMPPRALQQATLPDLDTLVERIRSEVQRSELAVPCARLASRLMSEYPGLAPDWLGQGGFRRFLESLPLEPYALDWSGSGGYIFDPERHTVRAPNTARTALDAYNWGVDTATLALIRQVHDTTGVPLLPPRDFRALFDAVVADVTAHPFQLNETGKRVRDLCRESGRDISRESVNWVLRGLLLCGHEFGQGQDDVPTLSYRLVGNLINLCRREQVMMDEGAPGVLQRWMSGKLGD
jgi:hypothetical protein